MERREHLWAAMNHLRFLSISPSFLILQIKQGKSWGKLGSFEANTSQLERCLSLLAQPLLRQPLLVYLFILQLALEGDSWGNFCLGARIYISEHLPLFSSQYALNNTLDNNPR